MSIRAENKSIYWAWKAMKETTWEQAEGFAVSVIREAKIKAKFWFTAWLVTFVVLITVVAAVLVM